MREWLKRWKWIVFAVALAAVAIVAVQVRGRLHEVKVAGAFTGPLTLRIAASGLVETDSVELGFQTSGRITAINVKEGDAVTESDVLAWIDPGTSMPATLGVGDVIQAPYDGTVVEVRLKVGAVVSPGVPVIRLVSARMPWVTAFIDSEDAVHLRPGHKLKCRAGGYLSEAFDLAVASVGREAVPREGFPGASKLVRVRCDVASPRFPLTPGTEVDVDGEVSLVADAILVPTAAVVHEGPNDRVWVVEGSRVQQREVEVGPNNFDLIQIRSGIQPGEEVVVNGKDGLSEGQRVRVSPMPPMTEEGREG
jgi:multidrug efflux pump subunit AcrA (membrane-fusion protein)